MIILSCLEIDLAIICASCPIFWPIIEKSLSAIFVSYEVQVVAERVDDYGLVYELEHMKGADGSVKSSGTSTYELREDEDRVGTSGESRQEFAVSVGVDPLNEEAKMEGFRTDIQSAPKPKWQL